MVEILIEKLRRLDGRGSLRAFCDVRIATASGDWVVRNCRIIRQPGQKAWFSLPVVSWENENKEVCYKTLLELPPGLKKRISETALRAYNEMQEQVA